MRQQTKQFIVERKPSRKLKSASVKPSIWGKLDLSLHQETQTDSDMVESTAAVGDDDRR
ncbi:hypothetical protein [Agrobacterium tumefaciens]|uniref:Uncharacterized protein n=1 Tax=Agrobacterium tumefaciens TaxID=358 RepID=A0A2L2LMV5_AGRTU|nr:hypothetical protein [Agrobacterium tumefaciens]AVH45655.1 hypothetical protein At1D1609_56220 [Agrobacterium tumefaciens]NSY99315.1 hypothetical protein [Agrobacterium tumefaciens]